jgi:putative peptide zinc metalloprotease protein|tara:strand:+ start:728 stop:1849 length:1122 start_codon:yes stop_codon:yes gene_type:complete
MENIEYIIEKTENEGIMLLHIGNNKYYIGESLSIIFNSFIKGIDIDAIVENLNLVTNSNKFNRELVTTIINEKIEPIIKNHNKVVKSSVKKIFRILDPIKFESFFKKFTFLFIKPIFYSILITTFLINLFFHFFFIKPDVTINKFQFPIILTGIVLIVLIHEIGHAIASFYYKITPKEIGFGLYFIFPALYTDLTEAWKLKKDSRIVINIAGIYFQLIINIFLIILLYTNFFNNHILYIIILSSQAICLFNLNPFFKFDGYWIYSDYFNIPNLRKQTYDLYKKIITNSNNSKKKSLFVYAFFYLLFIIYIIYRMVFFIFKQHRLIYKQITNNDISNVTIINWALLIFSFLLIYIIVKRVKKIYKTYFYENKIN